MRDERFFDSAGVRIRYVDRGAGEPVVLVHSYAGDLEDQWVKTGILNALARFYRVVAFDVRGHGGSGKPHDPQSYGAEMAWDGVRLMDHLAITRAHIIGYSMGAHIVVQLLTLALDRFVTATLGGASGRRDWTAEDDLRAEAEAGEMERGSLELQMLRLSPPGEPSRPVPLPDAAQIEQRSAAFLAGKDCRALAAVRRSNKAQVVTAAQLAAVRVPVLGIVGSADPYLAGFEALKKVMPQLKVVVLDGAIHASAPSHPGFVPALLGFLRLHPANRQEIATRS